MNSIWLLVACGLWVATAITATGFLAGAAWAAAAFFGNLFLGCIVLSFVDDEDRRLFNWASDAPGPLYILIVTCWPVVAWHFRRGR